MLRPSSSVEGVVPYLLCFLLGGFVLPGCASTPPPPPAAPTDSTAASLSYQVFPSGLRLVVREDPRADQVAVNVSFRVGASDEPAGKEGIASLAATLTSLARHGGLSAPRWVDRLSALGAKSEHFTLYDETEFWTTAAQARLPQLVKLEAQRMRDPLASVTEEDFQQARTQAVAMLRLRYETDSEGAQSRWLNEKLLQGHPYGRPLMGTPESLARLTLEEVRAFVKEHYTPAHAVLVVSSALPTVDVKFEVAQGFVSLTNTGRAEHTPPVQRLPPPLPESVRRGTPMEIVHGKVRAPQLYLVWMVPGLYSGQYFAPIFAAGGLNVWVKRRLQGDARVQAIRTEYREADGLTLLITTLTLREDLRSEQEVRRVAEYGLDMLGLIEDVLAGEVGHHLYRATLAQIHEQQRANPIANVARTLRATGRVDALRVREQQLVERHGWVSISYLRKYLHADQVRMMLVLPN
ncbi:MAG TPA: insulinase family protein [Archangium sp.]|nr:insulinase family protein [Archangium sp.]